MRRPLSPALDLSVSFTVWRGDKRQTYIHKRGEGKLLPSKAHFFSHKYFKMKFNELMTRRNLFEYIFLVPYKNIHKP